MQNDVQNHQNVIDLPINHAASTRIVPHPPLISDEHLFYSVGGHDRHSPLLRTLGCGKEGWPFVYYTTEVSGTKSLGCSCVSHTLGQSSRAGLIPFSVVQPTVGAHRTAWLPPVSAPVSKRVSVVVFAVLQQPRRVCCLYEVGSLWHHPSVPLGPCLPASPLQLKHGAVGPRNLPEVGSVVAERGPQQSLVDGVVRHNEGSALVLQGLEGPDLVPGVGGPFPEVSRRIPVGVSCGCVACIKLSDACVK